ncbi:MAG: radical SAM protein [Anaerocolumna sp.]
MVWDDFRFRSCDFHFTGTAISSHKNIQFANENFVDLLEYGQHLGFYQNVLSNATMITDEQIERIKNLNIGFQTSFNGIWEKNKGEWLLNKAIDNTRKLLQSGIKTIVTIIIKEYDEDKIKSIFDMCLENNIRNIRLGYELALGLNKEMDKIEYVKNGYRFNKNFEVIKEQYKGKLNISWQSEAKIRENDLFSKRMLLCEAGTSQIYIDNNGDAYPCPLFKSFNEFYGGNILCDNFRDVWYSENINKIRAFGLDETKCNDCDLICGSWCRGLMFSYTGDIKAHPYFCTKNKI